jgi:hypothetical protein
MFREMASQGASGAELQSFVERVSGMSQHERERNALAARQRMAAGSGEVVAMGGTDQPEQGEEEPAGKPESEEDKNDTVVLYSGSHHNFEKFDLEEAKRNRKLGTPEAGIYLTTDFNRAVSGYATGRTGHVARVEIPAEMAARGYRPDGGPNRNQPEWVFTTQEDVDILNQTILGDRWPGPKEASQQKYSGRSTVLPGLRAHFAIPLMPWCLTRPSHKV